MNDQNIPPHQYPPYPGPAHHSQPHFMGQNPPAPQPGYGPPHGQWQTPMQPPRPKSPFGVSFWVVTILLGLIVLGLAGTGHGEAIMVIVGLAALATGLYSLVFKRRSWLGIPHQKVASAVSIGGMVCALLGAVAGANSPGPQENTATPAPTTSAQLEADVAAKLKAREDAVAKREAAIGPAEKQAARSVIKNGTWTVGVDIVPGTYRTTKELSSSCYWSITRTGSNGGDIIQNDNVNGGFPQVVLSDGQTIESSRCGEWAKQ